MCQSRISYHRVGGFSQQHMDNPPAAVPAMQQQVQHGWVDPRGCDSCMSLPGATYRTSAALGHLQTASGLLGTCGCRGCDRTPAEAVWRFRVRHQPVARWAQGQSHFCREQCVVGVAGVAFVVMQRLAGIALRLHPHLASRTREQG